MAPDWHQLEKIKEILDDIRGWLIIAAVGIWIIAGGIVVHSFR